MPQNDKVDFQGKVTYILNDVAETAQLEFGKNFKRRSNGKNKQSFCKAKTVLK